MHRRTFLARGIGAILLTSTGCAASNSLQADSSMCAQIRLPEKGEFGGEGPEPIVVEHVANPVWRDGEVVVIHPKDSRRKYPVLFYSHAFGATDYRLYMELFGHLASHGNVVVYSPYQKFGASTEERYNTLWRGFETAVSTFGQYMDIDRVGYIGHSFGGGATPAMARRGITQKGWGKKAAFMFIMAPWYSYEITAEELRNFPKHVRLIMQVYDKDVTNDHRMAIDIYKNIGIPENQKNYIMLNSQERAGCNLLADHATPRDDSAPPLRHYGIYRLLDAIIALSFENKTEAEQIALGDGNNRQTFMGKWGDGVDVVPLTVSANPGPVQPESYYRFPWSDRKNERTSVSGQDQGNPEQPKRRRPLRRLFGID